MTLPAEISFIVSQNDKGGNPKRPDYRGEVKIGAAVYEVAAWRRKKAGSERQFISGTLKLKAPKVQPPSDPGETDAFPAPGAGQTDSAEPFTP